MRNISSSVLAELAQQTVRPFVAGQIEFADQVMSIWTGYGTLPIPTAGPELEIASTSESIGGTTVRIVLTNAPDVALALGQIYRIKNQTFATWLNGVDLTVTNVVSTVAFDAAFSHTTYAATADTGSAMLLAPLDYLGVGNLAGIAPVIETADLQANGVQLSLSGVPGDVLAESLAQCRQGMPVRLWLGFLDSSGDVIPSPMVAFIGRMDTVSVDEGADTAVITMTAESRLIDLQRSRIRRYTDDDQQRTSPGDLGFQYVPMVQDWNGSWGLNDRSNGK